jgi:hypothetical protein
MQKAQYRVKILRNSRKMPVENCDPTVAQQIVGDEPRIQLPSQQANFALNDENIQLLKFLF